MNWIYLNREICPGSSFNISPENRAFRFADGCFESIRIMEALPVFWNKHMERLLETAAFLQIQLPIPTEKILEIAKELIHRNEIQLGGKIRIMLFNNFHNLIIYFFFHIY